MSRQIAATRWAALIKTLRSSPAFLQELEECLNDFHSEEVRRMQEASVRALTDPTVKTYALSCMGRAQMCKELLTMVERAE